VVVNPDITILEVVVLAKPVVVVAVILPGLLITVYDDTGYDDVETLKYIVADVAPVE
jgi:hypothetical protein